MFGSVDMKMQQSLREVAMDTGMSLTSVLRVLKRHKFHPYGVFLTQKLKETDFDARMDFCEDMERRLPDLRPENLDEMCDRILEYSRLPDGELLQQLSESFQERIFLCMRESGKQFEQLL